MVVVQFITCILVPHHPWIMQLEEQTEPETKILQASGVAFWKSQVFPVSDAELI